MSATVPPLPDYSDAVNVLDEALTELQVVEDIDQAWSLLDYLAQRGWDLVRRSPCSSLCDGCYKCRPPQHVDAR